MSEHDNETYPAGVDPSFWRGLTQPRLTRRQMLGAVSGGVAASVLGGEALAGAALPNKGIGTPSWWKKQKLHHVVNFANWPLYIDSLKGKHPSLVHFTQTTGIKVNYSEVIQDNSSFYATIRPSLAAHQAIGYDIIVMTTNNPPLHYLMELGWLIPLDHTAMPNFNKYAGPLVKNPSWDPGNKYSMAWQSGWTSVAYNSKVVKNPGDSVGLLFSKKYAGRVGMMSDPFELGSVGLLAIGVEPDKSTESDWSKAAKKLRQQKSDGIPAAYYDQSYIQHLKNGDTVVSQCWSGDIFQANLSSKYKNLVLMIPNEGLMLWTDNMIIPLYASNPRDAMTTMDYFYSPQTESVVEYYVNYICAVPAAKQQLLHPTSWNKATLAALGPEIGLPPSTIANSPDIFPTPTRVAKSRNYYQFKNQEEINAWTSLFLPIIQG
ncbi:MAG: spermidine/putrescine ABC transporter substrate-binding protein [Acidobacteriota bacterium]|nr:spermidine/putrescine ABC transporter substrate-binding protein [Acidobacteriota bacterium]